MSNEVEEPLELSSEEPSSRKVRWTLFLIFVPMFIACMLYLFIMYFAGVLEMSGPLP